MYKEYFVELGQEKINNLLPVCALSAVQLRSDVWFAYNLLIMWLCFYGSTISSYISMYVQTQTKRNQLTVDVFLAITLIEHIEDIALYDIEICLLIVQFIFI